MSNILIELKFKYFNSSFDIILKLIIFVLFIFWIGGHNHGVEREVSIIFSIIVLISLYIHNKNTILIIDKEKSIYKTGFLENKTYEIKHIDVKDIQVFQNFFERVFGIGGSISISSSGQSDIGIKINGIEDYEKVKELINSQRNKNEKE